MWHLREQCDEVEQKIQRIEDGRKTIEYLENRRWKKTIENIRNIRWKKNNRILKDGRKQ